MKCKKIKKNGNTVLTMPITLVFSILIIIVLCVFVIDLMIPFIWYQKMQVICYKYMYVVEKYGYLTSSEKSMLLEELESKGFDKEEIEIDVPNTSKGYGELIEFSIKYNYKQKLPLLERKL